jgi:predicted DNA-binding protein
MDKTTVIAIRVPIELDAAIASVAKRERRKKSEYIRMVMEDHLNWKQPSVLAQVCTDALAMMNHAESGE